MTYRQLLAELEQLEEDQLDMNVTVDIDEEFFNIKEVVEQEGEDRLSDGHPYFTI
tara:strand:+ start:368 stop:532 length:165 start_codon:yes stop_codon:yes gene_type:complete